VSVTRRSGCAPADARMAGCRSMRSHRVSGDVTSTDTADYGLHAVCIAGIRGGPQCGLNKHLRKKTIKPQSTFAHKHTNKILTCLHARSRTKMQSRTRTR
jgi:hypothetical protein